jgi:hypothetical protein
MVESFDDTTRVDIHNSTNICYLVARPLLLRCAAVETSDPIVDALWDVAHHFTSGREADSL